MLFFFSSRRRHTRSLCDWSSDVCSSDLIKDNNQKILDIESKINESQTQVEQLKQETATINERIANRTEILKKRAQSLQENRSEERRVGKECRYRWSPYQ